LFAATYPTRTSSLVLIDTFARVRHRLGDPIGVGLTDEEIRAGQAMLEHHWGAFTDDMFALIRPAWQETSAYEPGGIAVSGSR
jgi:hypothetical protein